MKNRIFKTIKTITRPRANFDLSRVVKGSYRLGYLYPVLCEPTLPSDTFKINHSVLCRFAPMTAPVMHNIDLKMYYFNVPNRLVWKKFREFITGGEDGTESPIYPRLIIRGNTRVSRYLFEYFMKGSLGDSLGFPTVTSEQLDEWCEGNTYFRPQADTQIDLLPFIAYQLIYNEYFRDQNVMEEVDVDWILDYLSVNGVIYSDTLQFKGDTETSEDNELTAHLRPLFVLRKKCWDKTYLTSALPTPQRGESVPIPIDLTTSIQYVAPEDRPDGAAKQMYTRTWSQVDVASQGNIETDGDGKPFFMSETNPSASGTVDLKLGDTHEVKIDSVNSDITELRRAIKLQEFLEAMARGGSRYIEQIKSIFGVTSSDARLQRPEFKAASSQPVVISEVLQTSQTSDDSAQGNMSGRAISAGYNKGAKSFYEEHSLCFCIMCVMPRFEAYNYFPRKWQKFDRFDYYWPQFDHIGEQQIDNDEVHFSYLKGHNKEAFGYAPRYAEYKSAMDEVHGEFKDSLDFWHMANEYENATLSPSFLVPSRHLLERPFALQDGKSEQLYIEIYFDIKAKRQMSRYSTPMM